MLSNPIDIPIVINPINDPPVCTSFNIDIDERYLDKENPEELLNKIITYAQENIIPEMHKKSKNTGIYFKEKKMKHENKKY